jgi:Asp-tRNA(Asn)/Glu-tRNA(Gln) amidotransferase A subunit family amidase
MFYQQASLTEISISLRNNTLDLYTYINDSCDRLAAADKEIHAFLPEKGRRQRLLSEAEVLLEKYPAPSRRPPLFGVLIGVKDLFNVDGLPTKAGSKLPAKAFAGPQAAVVTRLKAAGALVLGKTHTTEFAYFSPGPTKNPVNTDYSPGGSSSGSAAAVAAGFTPLALGTQTIASITRPAAYCGIIGFKPTFSRISTAGVFPFAQSVDQVGFFTQDLTGAALAAGSLIEEWDANLRTAPMPRLFLPADAFLVQAECDAFNRFYEKVDLLTDRGYEVIPYPLFKDIKEVNRVHRELIAAEFARNHKALYKEHGDLYSEKSHELYQQGIKVSKATLAADLSYLQTYRRTMRELMRSQGVDVWICPAATSAAPKGLASTGNPLMSLPWTFLGLPSITLPVSKSSHNLPLGLQIVGGYGRDERLLHYANELFQVLGY